MYVSKPGLKEKLFHFYQPLHFDVIRLMSAQRGLIHDKSNRSVFLSVRHVPPGHNGDFP